MTKKKKETDNLNNLNVKLLKEEQSVLDNVIERLEERIHQKEDSIDNSLVRAKKANESGVPEAYGSLVAARHKKTWIEQKIEPFKKARDELYENHLIVESRIGDKLETLDLKVGNVTCLDSEGKPIIVDYRADMVFPFIGADYLEESSSDDTSYRLLSRIKDTIISDKIVDAIQLFSDQNKFYDHFLDELIANRSNPEFQNIIFSIKKKQKDIIQAPLKTNIIVQGCAGSGKSMVMFHRLPIIMFKNPYTFNLKNVYVVTPSISYMKMVHNMLEQLDIEDVQMGTLEDYFHTLILQYNYESRIYKWNSFARRIPAGIEKKVYSKEFFGTVGNIVIERYKQISDPCERGIDIYEIKFEQPGKRTVAAEIALKKRIAREILNKQKGVIEQYRNYLLEACSVLKNLHTMLCFRKEELQRKIKDHFPSGFGKREIAVLNDEEYYAYLSNLGKKIETFFLEHGIDIKQNNRFSDETVYQLISRKKQIVDFYVEWKKFFETYQDPYLEYGDSFLGYLKNNKTVGIISSLGKYNQPYLSYKRIKQIKKYIKELNQLPNIVYQDVMMEMGLANKKEEMPFYKCSPYVFLLCLLYCRGVPIQNEDKYIFIDEAQNLSRAELDLIKIVNGKKVIFNLFGDVNQHIEGSKGVDAWSELCEIKEYEHYLLEENYRNAVPITEYCNKNLNLSMQAICVDGFDVFETGEETDLHTQIVDKLRGEAKGNANAIIIKDMSIAKKVINYLNLYNIPFKNHLFSPEKPDLTKWNLFSVEGASGLEFKRVFVISSNMTKNEQYIAYTRALDELFIYSGSFDNNKVSK